MSRLAGKAYEDSEHTIVIAVVHWVKHIIIVQKLTPVVEIWVLVSFRWSPLPVDRSCDVTYVCSRCTTMMQPNAIACVSECVAKLFSSWKLQDTACDWSLQESCKLLISYSQLLLIQRILSYWNSTVLTKPECIHQSVLLSILAIDLPSEEASVSYPECILWATVYPDS